MGFLRRVFVLMTLVWGAPVVLITFILPTPILAQEAVPDILTQARTALAQGQFQRALDLAQGPLAQAAPFDAAMIEARAALELGQPNQALAAAKRAQTARPKDSAARAIEGIAHLRLGQNRPAMLALRRALDLAQTPQEKTIARQFLRQAQATQTWRWTGGVGLAPSSNINKATTAQTITLTFNGQTLQAPLQNGQAVSGTGLRLYGEVGRDFALKTRAKWVLNFGISGNLYEDSAFSNQTGQVSLAYHLPPRPRAQTSLRLAHQTTRFGRDAFSDTSTLEFKGTRALPHPQNTGPNKGPRFLDYTLGYDDQNRYDAPANDNHTKRMHLAYRWTPTPSQQWSLGVYQNNRTSSSNFIAARHWGLDLGARIAPRPGKTGLQWDLKLGLGRGDWARKTATETAIRHTQDISVSISAQNNNTSFWGLTPTYGISYLRRKSNLPQHAITSTDLFLGLANAF